MKILIVCLLTAAYVLGNSIYDAYRPIETVVTERRVFAGDTLYEICNDAYMAENNAECFNAFLDSNYRANKSDLQIGDTVVITNKIYK